MIAAAQISGRAVRRGPGPRKPRDLYYDRIQYDVL